MLIRELPISSLYKVDNGTLGGKVVKINLQKYEQLVKYYPF